MPHFSNIKYILFLLISANTFIHLGQWQYWGGIGITKKTALDIKASGTIEYRHEVGNGFDQLNLKPEISRKIVKGVDGGIEYRLAIKPNNSNNANSNFIGQQRFGLELSFSPLKWTEVNKRWSLGIDFKQQWNWRVTSRDLSILRTKLSGSYDVKDSPIGPYFSTEWFYCWNQDLIYGVDEITPVPGNRAWRTFAGITIETSKKSSLKLLAGVNRRIDKGSQQFILNLAYSLSLP
jgi:Protein of unknown function (DUF2490)